MLIRNLVLIVCWLFLLSSPAICSQEIERDLIPKEFKIVPSLEEKYQLLHLGSVSWAVDKELKFQNGEQSKKIKLYLTKYYTVHRFYSTYEEGLKVNRIECTKLGPDIHEILIDRVLSNIARAIRVMHGEPGRINNVDISNIIQISKSPQIDFYVKRECSVEQLAFLVETLLKKEKLNAIYTFCFLKTNDNKHMNLKGNIKHILLFTD
ncbi:hypothetical protein [Candidatus Uabimicrobium sp. HlEnr_7]|uniref:hypothetical protein n=1 Tax=Candidatus Uabimicrobium helgolandensis TaxID=3095367 RepID=UPI0035574E15